jgi:L-threonylcarbamoyladenylate synthase
MNFEEDIKRSLAALKDGGVILYPTDTIWGLGCDATNTSAIEKVIRLKSRAEGKSMIILVNGIDMLERYVKEIPQSALQLISVSDSPLTIIYPEGKNLAAGICNADKSVGIRICDEPFCNELITRFRKPLVSTSANISGKTAPGNFSEIEEGLVSSVDYCVTYKQDDRRKSSPSPVISFDKNGVFRILRK